MKKRYKPLIRVFWRREAYLCVFLLTFSFALGFYQPPRAVNYAGNALLRVPELPPAGGLIASIQVSDAAIPGALSSPPRLGEVIAGYPVSDIRRIRERHPTTGQTNVWHKGFDIATPVGTPIYAPFEGEVTECQRQGDWGIYGVFESPLFPRRYWLLHHLSWCQEGRYVRGDIWAKTGDAGTGPHLHIEGWIKNPEWAHYDLARGWIEGFLNAGSRWLG